MLAEEPLVVEIEKTPKENTAAELAHCIA